MATAMIYDTLKLAEQLEYEAGFDAARARSMARILADNAGGNLATREDLLVVKADLEAAIRATEEKLGGSIRATEEKLGGSIRAVEEKLGGSIRAVEERLGALEDKVSGLEGSVAGLGDRVDELGDRVGRLEQRVGVLYWVTGTTLAGVAALLSIAITVVLHVMRLE